jgi:hypothetical protein
MGSTLAFGAVLAVVLVILGIGFLLIVMYMGAGNELKNAVDAGALNLGKKSVDEVTVSIDSSNFFYDVTNDGDVNQNDGKVNLRRINRVWAKALAVAINADAAGGQAGSGDNSAAQAYSGAHDISQNLFNALTANPQATLQSEFTAFAQANSVRMLGAGLKVNVVQGPGWSTSTMDAGDESNIILQPNGLPPGYTLPSSMTTACTRNPMPSGASGLQFLTGYTPLTINNRTFWQVPFQFDEKPHLVSLLSFTNAKAKGTTWDFPVPNAFSVEGNAAKSGGVTETADSWVQANPRQSFKLSVPHSYVHFHVEDMKSHWYFNPSGYPAVSMGVPNDQDYSYTPDLQSSDGPFGALGCSDVAVTDVEIGIEVVGRTIDYVVFGSPNDDSTEAGLEANVTNRCAQMITDINTNITATDVHNAMGDSATIAELALVGDRDFYLFSSDGKTLTCMGKTRAQATGPQWLQSMIGSNGDDDADGSENQVFPDDASQMGPPLIPFAQVDTTNIGFCPFGTVVDPAPTGYIQFYKELWWTPGTGYNGCLGKIRVQRWTNVYAWCGCPPC